MEQTGKTQERRLLAGSTGSFNTDRDTVDDSQTVTLFVFESLWT